MQSPDQLRVFIESERLALDIHRLCRTLPAEERYGLSQQMRRAAVSVGSNIAEGCGRGGTRELAHFLGISLGSAAELQFQLRLAFRLGYIDSEDHDRAAEQARRVQRMLIRFILRLTQPQRSVPKPEKNR
jgi:four helix bundle protein